jgi:hypothetical protein
MPIKSITLNRSVADQLEDRKHPQPYDYEEEESDTYEANQLLLGSGTAAR